MAKVKPWNEENTKEALRLYKQGTSVAELKKRFQSYGNPIVTRLKAAGVYKAGRAVAATKPVKVKAGKKAAAPQATLRTNGMTTKEVVDQLARSVATAAFGDARFTPVPMTRTEIFERIQDGVEQGVKRMKIGFHA